MLADMKKTEIVLKGTENKSISLDYILPSKIKGPIVLYAHGFNGFKDWGGMDLVAAEFAKKGMPFIKFNFSHNGTTPELPTEFTDLEAYGTNTISKELNDFFIVYNWVTKEFTKQIEMTLPVVLIGHSKGGSESIVFTARKRSHISKLITWAAPARADIPWYNWPTDKIFEWKRNGFTEIENKRTKQKLKLGLELLEDFENHKINYDVLSSASKVSVPWLICHGDADESVDLENAFKLHEANLKSELLIIKKTGHTFDRAHPWQQKTLPLATKKLIRESIKFALAK